MTDTNSPDTVRAQIEGYHIDGWLIRNKGLELLLPEGFFINRPAMNKKDILYGKAPRTEITGIKTLGPKELEEVL